MAEPLDYRRPSLGRKPRRGLPWFALVAVILSFAGGAIARMFHRGVFDNNRYGGIWVNWALAGIGLSAVGIACAFIELLQGRYLVRAAIAIMFAIGVMVYGCSSPFPKNVPLP